MNEEGRKFGVCSRNNMCTSQAGRYSVFTTFEVSGNKGGISENGCWKLSKTKLSCISVSMSTSVAEFRNY